MPSNLKIPPQKRWFNIGSVHFGSHGKGSILTFHQYAFNWEVTSTNSWESSRINTSVDIADY